jgi:hypothetical protein
LHGTIELILNTLTTLTDSKLVSSVDLMILATSQLMFQLSSLDPRIAEHCDFDPEGTRSLSAGFL